jgi:hypothetical protein
MNKRIKTLKIALARMTKVGERLDDIQNWETGDTDIELTKEERESNKTHRRGVGWDMTPEQIGITKWIMEDAPGDWVFVVPDNVKNIEEKVRSEAFKTWLQERGYGEGHNIFVVGRQPMEGDFNDPNWIVHDLVGHSVGNKFVKLQKAYGIKPNTWIGKPDSIQMIAGVWSLLPDNLKNTDAPFDRIYDIAAGIIFGKISLEDSLAVVDGMQTENATDLIRNINLMFSSARSWLGEQNWIQVGGNKVCVIYPWQ